MSKSMALLTSDITVCGISNTRVTISDAGFSEKERAITRMLQMPATDAILDIILTVSLPLKSCRHYCIFEAENMEHEKRVSRGRCRLGD